MGKEQEEDERQREGDISLSSGGVKKTEDDQ